MKVTDALEVMGTLTERIEVVDDRTLCKVWRALVLDSLSYDEPIDLAELARGLQMVHERLYKPKRKKGAQCKCPKCRKQSEKNSSAQKSKRTRS